MLAIAALMMISGLVAAQAPGTSAASAAASLVCGILQNVKVFFELVAAGIAIVIIVINGIKWIGSSDDPGARKQAKEGIIHAVVGLVIVLLAVEIVGLVVSTNCLA
ncbi:MAG: TrbC/VirB2 family protein [Candidatus Altiarchaeota archaeon]